MLGLRVEEGEEFNLDQIHLPRRKVKTASRSSSIFGAGKEDTVVNATSPVLAPDSADEDDSLGAPMAQGKSKYLSPPIVVH